MLCPRRGRSPRRRTFRNRHDLSAPVSAPRCDRSLFRRPSGAFVRTIPCTATIRCNFEKVAESVAGPPADRFHRHPRVTPRGKTAVREYSYSVLILLYFLHELKARGLNKTTRDGKSSGLRINQRHTSGAGSQAHTTHGGSVNILAHPLRFHIYTLLQSSYGTLSTVHYREIDTNRYQAT